MYSSDLIFARHINWWLTKEYRLQKLLAYILCAKVVFDDELIRVNTEDDEDWDLIYPKYDDEVLQYST